MKWESDGLYNVFAEYTGYNGRIQCGFNIVISVNMSTFNVVCAVQINDVLIELLKLKYEIIFVLEIYVTCEIVFVNRGLDEVMFL